MATDTEAFFTKTRPARLFFSAAIPGALGMVISSIYEVMDGVFVGQFVGETAFAAINLAMPFVIIDFAFGDLIGVGSAVPISIAHGAGDRDKANNIFTCACLLNVVTGFLLGLAFLLAAPTLMAAMGATGELARQGAIYLQVYSLFLPITAIAFAADNYLRICGRIRYSLVVNMLLAVSGAAIEYVLLGIVGFGVGGAALSYSIALVLCVVVALWPFFRQKMELKFVKPRLSRTLIWEIARNGAPAFLSNVASRLAAIVLNVVLLAVGGTDAVSIYGTLMFTDAVVVPLTYGTLDALQPAVGYNYGAKLYGRVKSLERYCFAAAAAISAVYIVAVNAFPAQIVQVFIPDVESSVLDEAVGALRLFSLAYLFRWFPFAMRAYMVAVGQARLSSVISLVDALVSPLIALAILWPFGLTGIWLNMLLSSVLATIVAAWCFAVFRRGSRW